MKIRQLILVAATSLPLVVLGQYHDPALDGINVNLGYLNADTVGGLNEVETAIGTLSNTLPAKIADAQLWTNTTASTEYMRTGASNTATRVGVTYSNAIAAYNRAIQDSAATLASPVSNLMTNFSGAFFLSSTNLAMDEEESKFVIPLLNGGHFDFDIKKEVLEGVLPSNYRSTIYNLILVSAYLIVMVYLAGDLKGEIGHVLSQRQIQGTHISAFGWEVSAVTAAAYALALTGFIVQVLLILFQLSFLSTIRSFASATGFWSYLNVISGWPMYDLISSWVPIGTICSLVFTYYFMRYVVITPLFFFVRGLIWWAIV